MYESWNVKDMRTIPTVIQAMNSIHSTMVARLRVAAAEGIYYPDDPPDPNVTPNPDAPPPVCAKLHVIEQLTGPALGVDEDTDYRYLESSWRVTIGENVPDP